MYTLPNVMYSLLYESIFQSIGITTLHRVNEVLIRLVYQRNKNTYNK